MQGCRDVLPQCFAALQQRAMAGHGVCGACSIFICMRGGLPKMKGNPPHLFQMPALAIL